MPIIAKLEKPEAIARLDAILDKTDGVMVARGDLGHDAPVPGMEVAEIGETACIAVPAMRDVPMVNHTVGLGEVDPADDTALDAIAAFYATIAVATTLGVALNFTPINPISALYWSAVVNGVLADPTEGPDSALYAGHSYAVDPQGTIEAIEKLTRDQLVRVDGPHELSVGELTAGQYREEILELAAETAENTVRAYGSWD